MRAGAPAAVSWHTWLLAAVFLVLVDGVVTHSSILWRRTSFEDTRDMGRIAFAQTYQAAREIYAHPARSGGPVVLLGNSRIWLAARPGWVEPELTHLAPGLDVEIRNLGIFGAKIGDVEVLSRHLARLAPRLVVVTLGPADLVAERTSPLAGVPADLLAVGWRDGPLPPADGTERVDRWLRTAWPLYRFREFARAAIEDRVAPAASPASFPAHFPSTRALFEYMHGAKAADVEAAYQTWRGRGALGAFVEYVGLGSPFHLEMVRSRARETESLGETSPGLRVLDALLDRLARARWPSRVVLMPENPLLDEDTAGEYHRPGVSDGTADLVRRTAAARGIPVIDDRRSMPAEAFLDFDHLLPELSGFQRRLAREIADALES